MTNTPVDQRNKLLGRLDLGKETFVFTPGQTGLPVGVSAKSVDEAWQCIQSEVKDFEGQHPLKLIDIEGNAYLCLESGVSFIYRCPVPLTVQQVLPVLAKHLGGTKISVLNHLIIVDFGRGESTITLRMEHRSSCWVAQWRRARGRTSLFHTANDLDLLLTDWLSQKRM